MLRERGKELCKGVLLNEKRKEGRERGLDDGGGKRSSIAEKEDD